ncbi:MAG: c-type cytochrome [Solirubrobacteraceae bacterium MAG38_C4-C5]|nr:c-type cytochrome [Candidatus Siliceabacter maunaloa]
MAGGVALWLLAGGGAPTDEDPGAALSGGADATVFDTSPSAFALPLRKLGRLERRAFAVGNSFFNDNWVTAPASTEARDGLGPTFNAQSCSSCHFKDGRGQPPQGPEDPERGLLLRLSIPGPDGQPRPVPVYGSQLQDRAISGVSPEGSVAITHVPRRGSYADGTRYTLLEPRYAIAGAAFGPIPADVMTSPRVAPPVFGTGLLEAVAEEDIVALADPTDADGDGISGRANRVPDAASATTSELGPEGGTALGRFGWKANVPDVEQQNAQAFHGDIGVTSPLFTDQNCPEGQEGCADAPAGGRPEIDEQRLGRVTFYVRTLAVPARRGVGDPTTTRGEDTFRELGCAACHLPELQTGPSDVPGLSNQAIRPYTDLLLHDMGPGLADGRPDGLASGSEWRTAPLWGIGLTETVNGHTRFLHDGRARNLEEAILWHGGEAAGAQRRFRALPRDDREALLAFLRSL